MSGLTFDESLYSQFEVYAHGIVCQRVGASKGGGNGIWWNTDKRNRARKHILGFNGRWKTRIDIIYARNAYQDLYAVVDDRRRLEELVLDHSKDEAVTIVCEWGEKCKVDYFRSKPTR